jgi:hypothetical protein
LPRDGGQPLGVGAAAPPLDEDTIALGEDAKHLEADVGKAVTKRWWYPILLLLSSGTATPRCSAA